MKNPILFISALLLVLICSAGANAQQTRISVTVAGMGTLGYYGDNGPAKRATLSHPFDVAVDAAHNVYFTDQSNSRIRKLTSKTGIISTIAGGGATAADGVPATSVPLTLGNICSDAAGNLYIIASTNKVQRIDAITNIITNIAGGGTSTADGIPATSALLSTLTGITIDATGNIYLVSGNTIRKINAATGILTTIAGSSTVAGYSGDGGIAVAATLNDPKYIAVDHAGNIFFGDQHAGSFGDYIRRIDGTTGIITSIIGVSGTGPLYDCPGTATMIGPMSGICCDDSGNVIFNESSCSCRKWRASTGWVYPVAGNFYMESFSNDTSSNFALMAYQYGICADEESNFYIADQGNNRIRKIIQLTPKPSFAFGEAQHFTPCPSSSYPLDSLLWITDKDSAQTETWSIISGPANGTLTGFPISAISNGVHETVKPTGLFYNAATAYTGADSFKVLVTDGIYSDTITVYANVQIPPTPTITGGTGACIGGTVALAGSIPGGSWSSSNIAVATVGSSTGVVSCIAPGVATITYSVNYGCTVSDTRIVSANALPAPGTIMGADTLCVGGTTTMTETVPGGVWSSSAPSTATIGAATGIVSAVAAITAYTTIRYTVTSGACSSYVTKNFWVYSPNTGVITGYPLLCIGSVPVTFTSTVPGGIWGSSSPSATVGATSGIVTAVSPGLDSITYTVTNGPGCSSTSIYSVNILPALMPGMISGPSSVCAWGLTATFTSTAPGGTWNTTNPSASIHPLTGLITGLAAGLDTVIYTVGSPGCAVSTATPVNVTPFALPTPGSITGPANVCTGATVLLSNSAPGGTWSLINTNASISSTGNITGILPGIDSIIYTVTNTCGTAATGMLINIITLPVPGTVTGSDEVCMQSTITLTNTTASATGTWATSNTNATVTSTGDVYGVNAGVVTIAYNVTNECGTTTASKDITVTDCIPADLSDVAHQTAFCVYPNPASSILTISWSSLLTSANVSITDITGREVLQDEINNTQKTKSINVSSLADGVYLMTISGNGVLQVTKVTISR